MFYVLKMDFAKLMMWPSDWRHRPEYVKRYRELVRRANHAKRRTAK